MLQSEIILLLSVNYLLLSIVADIGDTIYINSNLQYAQIIALYNIFSINLI